MDERQRSQLALIIEHELDLTRRAENSDAASLYASMSAQGTLGSGAVIRRIDKVMRAWSEALLKTLAEKAVTISADLEAFAMVEAALDTHFENMRPEVERALRMAWRSSNPPTSVRNAANEHFEKVQSDLRTKLAISRFDFEGATASPLPDTIKAVGPVAKNLGGKPLAAHWDAMWAEIAVQLWNGDLKPTKQKDISDAMFAWFNAKEINAGNTAVTERARALWLKVEAKLRG